MSAHTEETRTSQDPAPEEEWASDEAGAAQHETMAEGFAAARDARDERDERDEADPVSPELAREPGQYAEPGQLAHEPDRDLELDQDGELDQDAELDRDLELDRDRNAFANTATVDPVVGADDEFGEELVEPESLGASAAAADPVVPAAETVAQPEDLGGRNASVLDEPPLVAAEAQEEFLSRWSRIQVSFLEDPSAAVESAEQLIEDVNAAIRTSLEERSGELAAGGRAASDTEQRRLALRRYRAFIGVVLPKESLVSE